MPIISKPKLQDVLGSWLFWLIIVTVIAIVIRLIPAFTNAAWGCDFGIYYGLTNSFVETKSIFNPYNGWGSSYQYFPILYAITGVAHWITGLDVLAIMPKIAPIFGGLSIFVFYFLVYELIGDRKKALFSSLLLAVLPFHVYQTSHASPLTLGHFFMILSLYFFVKYRKNSKFIIPLIFSTGLLIMSHHFSTYIYLVSLIFIVFFENFSTKQWTQSIKKDILYIVISSGFIFSYWYFIATPIYESFMKSGIKAGPISLGGYQLIILFYLGFFTLFLFIWLKRKLNIFRDKKVPSAKSALMKFSLTLFLTLAIMIIFSAVKMPWTNFSFTANSIILAIPLLVIIALGVAGFSETKFEKNGFFIRGWLFGIIISFLYGLTSFSTTIYPHRHIEYMMAPISIIAVYGIEKILLNVKIESKSDIAKKFDKSQAIYFFKNSKIFQKRNLSYLAIFLIIVAANAASVYPSHVSLNASYEGITEEDLDAIDWIKNNMDENTSVIASDHRLARLAEAVGFNTTIDESSIIWICDDFEDCLFELKGIGKNYSRITHVIIDDIMFNRLVHVGFGKIFYMTNESYEKFSYQPFELEYRVVGASSEGEANWAEVYSVNWTYIDNFY